MKAQNEQQCGKGSICFGFVQLKKVIHCPPLILFYEVSFYVSPLLRFHVQYKFYWVMDHASLSHSSISQTKGKTSFQLSSKMNSIPVKLFVLIYKTKYYYSKHDWDLIANCLNRSQRQVWRHHSGMDIYGILQKMFYSWQRWILLLWLVWCILFSFPFRQWAHMSEDFMVQDGLERRGFKESGFLNAVTEVVTTGMQAVSILAVFKESWTRLCIALSSWKEKSERRKQYKCSFIKTCLLFGWFAQ